MTVRKYRVREGFTYGVAKHPAGTILDLDDSVAQHAMDKLELVEYDSSQAKKIEDELHDEDPQALHVTPQASDPGEPPEEPTTEEEASSRPRSTGSAKRK